MNQQGSKGIVRKLKALDHAAESKAVHLLVDIFRISRETFCQCKRTRRDLRDPALINSKPCFANPKLRTPLKLVEDSSMVS